MKIALITDTHFGVKNDAPEFVKYQCEFYNEQFFPRLEEAGIKTIFHLGDIFDRRKYTNHATLAAMRECFFDRLIELDIRMYLIVGNHDTYYKDTNFVNAPALFLNEYSSHIRIVDRPTHVEMGNKKFLLVPWINNTNYADMISQIQQSDADILGGHFEINGFEMHRGGAVATHGLDGSLFSKFDEVWSGHFHEPSQSTNIRYLGAPYEYTWADYNCNRGFYFYDCVDGELEYFRNKSPMFNQFIVGEDFDYSVSVDEYAGKVVRVIVSPGVDRDALEGFTARLQNVNPYHLEVVDNTAYHLGDDQVISDAELSEDSLSVVRTFVDSVEIDLDKDVLMEKLNSIYVEALAQ